MSEKERWVEAREQRKFVTDAKAVQKVIAIIVEFNKRGEFPTTREISNVYSGMSADDSTMPTAVQDAILQGILNPLRKQNKLSAKYWHMNQLIWRYRSKKADTPVETPKQ